MNQTKWDTTAGLHQPSKPLLALGAVALAGAFVVRLPAQGVLDKSVPLSLSETPSTSELPKSEFMEQSGRAHARFVCEDGRSRAARCNVDGGPKRSGH